MNLDTHVLRANNDNNVDGHILRTERVCARMFGSARRFQLQRGV